MKGWAWETYWLVGGFFSWIIVPWILGLLMTRDLIPVLRESSTSSLVWTYAFGVLWGLGGLTFGLTMRYLGMSLGMAVALGYTAAFGTLMPPIFRGQFASEVLGTHSGQIILVGVGVCLFGIVFAGAAGMSKEKEMSEEQKRASIKEFDLKKGLLVATFSGVMSACFAYGLAAGDPIKELTIRHGTPPLWQGLPVLVVLLFGGFTTNFIWCAILNVRNRTGSQYFSARLAKAGAAAHRNRNRHRRTIGRNGQGRHPVRRCSGPCAYAVELSVLGPGGHHVVHAVFLLHHGRDANGPVQILQLDATYGQHHDFQYAVGYRPARVEWHGPAYEIAGGRKPVRADRVHDHRGLRELSRCRRHADEIRTRALSTSS